MRQEPNEDLEALDDQTKQDWQLVTTEDQKGGGRAHLTIMTDSATEKMRITFEAHQLVSNFFNPDDDPIGHVGKGALVVSGQHARLDNIDDKGRWIEDESCNYLETSSCIGRERVPGGHWSNWSRSEGVILISWSTMMFIPNHPPIRTISLCHGSLQSKGGCIQYPSIRGIALLLHLAMIHTR